VALPIPPNTSSRPPAGRVRMRGHPNPKEVSLSDPWALARYQAIAAYIAMSPDRGRRGPLLAQLAARSWPGPDGEPFQVTEETLRVWVRRYRRGGLDALADAPHPRHGVKVLTEDEVAMFCALKREVPSRSLVRLIRIAEDLGHIEKGKARRSTLHRALQAHQLSARRAKPAAPECLDRYQTDFPNEIWQSDMLQAYIPLFYSQISSELQRCFSLESRPAVPTTLNISAADTSCQRLSSSWTLR
jgi:transposase